MKRVDPKVLAAQDEVSAPPQRTRSFATLLEDAWPLSLLLVLLGAYYEVHTIRRSGFHLDINGFIFLVLMLGLLFHWRPIRYVRAFEASARTVGPILLQFPLYGGIMGIITGTGLAALIATHFVAFSSARTLPFWTFISPEHHHVVPATRRGHWASAGVHGAGGGGSCTPIQPRSPWRPRWASRLPTTRSSRSGRCRSWRSRASASRDIMGYRDRPRLRADHLWRRAAGIRPETDAGGERSAPRAPSVTVLRSTGTHAAQSPACARGSGINSGVPASAYSAFT
jgi:hypothetical protein